ncbi:MAG: energy transducer TonB [Sphingomonadales bacterium]|nr:energy transducer TonB [Sphingomonadales bacterium]NCQ21114.1 energy transducer TonB [Sphingomonadales bacterium]NCT03903.1 energy transducer TonB [Sphingomonadales bacterium]
MGEYTFRNDEKVGLAAAVVLHGALVAVLLMQTVRSEISVFPERMTVSLATEVGLEAASPDPASESRAAIAPTLSDDPAPAPEPAPPERVERAPAPQPRPQPTRAARPTPAPAQPAASRDRSRPDRTPAPRASSTPAPRPTSNPAPTRAANSGGGSRIGDDFLEGRGASTTTTETRAPAAAFGRAEQAALSSAITRQLRPHWSAPSGVDTEKLVSIVSWNLNADGTLRGRPTCKTTEGSITASNRPQASVHCERAIRAVQLAAPFNLPEQFYDRWKALEWQFDRRL